MDKVFESVFNPRQTLRKTNWIGDDSCADVRAPARMREMAAAARTVGWPGDVREGIFDGTEKIEYPACGGGMRRSFALKRALNRPMQPRSSDLPWKSRNGAFLAF